MVLILMSLNKFHIGRDEDKKEKYYFLDQLYWQRGEISGTI